MPVSEKEQQQINSLVARFEAATRIQAVVAVVTKTDVYPEIPWKAYAIALLVIVPPERKMRIEVGYGLEDRLTGVQSNLIIRNVMAPHFKAADFDFGIMPRSNWYSGRFLGGGSSGGGSSGSW